MIASPFSVPVQNENELNYLEIGQRYEGTDEYKITGNTQSSHMMSYHFSCTLCPHFQFTSMYLSSNAELFVLTSRLLLCICHPMLNSLSSDVNCPTIWDGCSVSITKIPLPTSKVSSASYQQQAFSTDYRTTQTVRNLPLKSIFIFSKSKLVYKTLLQNAPPSFWSLFKSNPKHNQHLNNCLLSKPKLDLHKKEPCLLFCSLQ